MTHEDVQAWLDRYVQAWLSYDRDEIGALFTEDVEYRWHPYDEPVVGRDAVIEAWLGESGLDHVSTRDEPGTYEAGYRPVAVDGDTAVAVGTSTYFDRPRGKVIKTYDNCYLLVFDDEGRCSRFTEWYMKRPAP
jgi:ketosteroid isomerase-like protein